MKSKRNFGYKISFDLLVKRSLVVVASAFIVNAIVSSGTAYMQEVVIDEITPNVGDQASADNLMNTMCGAYRVGFGAYIPRSSVTVSQTGNVSFDVYLRYKRCNANETRAYALIGSDKLCPYSGSYGGSGDTYDCVKYYYHDGVAYKGPARLGCGPGNAVHNENCVNSATWGAVGIERNQPDTNPDVNSNERGPAIGMGGQIPNWSDNPGTYNMGIGKPICQFFKVGTNFGQSNAPPNYGCQQLYVKIRWHYKSWNVIPSVDVPTSKLEVGTSTPVAATARVDNKGSDASNGTQYAFGRVVYKSGTAPKPGDDKDTGVAVDSTEQPTVYFGGDWKNTGGNTSYATGSFPVGLFPPLSPYSDSQSIAGLEIGDRMCWTMSVGPATHTGAPAWRHAMRCVVVGVKPKVQIHGYDARVGGKIRASQYTTIDNKYYGSWGEYGMFAGTGGIHNVQSASALSDGSDIASAEARHNKLSFANTGTWAPQCTAGGGEDLKNGCYGEMVYPTATVGSLVTKCGDSSTWPTTATINDASFNGKDVVCVKGNAIIDGEINEAGFTKQKVIVAKNIYINHDVKKVNAWLVAHDPTKPTDTAGAGDIVTCNTPKVTNNLASTNKQLTVNDCSDQLQVNGFIIAKRLYSYRTTPGDASDRGKPAEIYNVRANAFIWARNGAASDANAKTVAQTKYVEELPPRF